MNRKKFGTMLRELREKRGLTQADVSTKLGYTSPQFVSNIERGITSFPEGKVKMFAKVLQVNPEALLRDIYTAKLNLAKAKYL